MAMQAKLCPLVPLASALLIMAVALSPLYIFEGAVSGYVGLMDYNLTLLGKDVIVDVLDKPRLLVAASLIAPIQVLVTLLVYPYRPLLSRRLLVGASYNLVMAASLLWALTGRLVADIVEKLLARESIPTNMGSILLGKTVVEPSLVGRLWPILLTVSMLAAIAYIVYCQPEDK